MLPNAPAIALKKAKCTGGSSRPQPAGAGVRIGPPQKPVGADDPVRLQERGILNMSKRIVIALGGNALGNTATVPVHINRIREAVEEDPSNPKHILTIWGVGYKFQV